MSARNPLGIQTESAKNLTGILADSERNPDGIRKDSACPDPARSTRDKPAPRSEKETALTSNRPRARERDAFRSGKGMGTWQEAVAASGADAIRRAEAVVDQAVPGCHPDLRCRLIGRAVLHGDLTGSVNRGELAALHARLLAGLEKGTA